ncbi:MAG: response regulator transcription factor [Anaerolineales bacterium]|nr:response regulator transcription factor [Chloroflexota bacterium]MBL6980505.1 response regulator transcription factor [Anaerolineales bacterium]
MTESPIRVVLVDDHQVLREGLRVLLDEEGDIQVVAEAGSAEEALEQVLAHDPDIVVMDLGLPDKSGLEAIKEIRAKDYPVRIIVLSMHSGRELVMQALQAGSDGYVPKSSAHTDLLQAIRTVHQGKRFLHPDAATAVVDELLERQAEAQMLESLSERESEVLRLTAMGYTSREVGEQLSLSPKTVDTYRQRAMEKLDLKHRSEVIQFALKAGLLDEINHA